MEHYVQVQTVLSHMTYLRKKGEEFCMLFIPVVQMYFEQDDGDAKDDVLNIKEPIEHVKQPHGFGPTLNQRKLAL